MRIAFLGAGNMGQALIKGLCAKHGGLSIIAYDTNPRAVEQLPQVVAVQPPRQWRRCVKEIDAVVIAVKPVDIAASLGEFAAWPSVDRLRPLWISIAAGVRIQAIQEMLGAKARVCRVMPNTPCLIGEGFSAYCLSSTCKKADLSIIETVLAAAGTAVQTSEKYMNAVTGLSGCGPAYVFLFIEALIEGGIAAGLPYETARAAALQTVAGAAALARQSAENLAELRRKVTSPGGATARGLIALEENRFRYSIVKAVADATARAKELEEISARTAKGGSGAVFARAKNQRFRG